MKGTLTVLAMFALGCIAGALGILPQSLADGGLAKIVLYMLMFLVGVNIGGNPDLKKIFGSVDSDIGIQADGSRGAACGGARHDSPALERVPRTVHACRSSVRSPR